MQLDMLLVRLLNGLVWLLTIKETKKVSVKKPNKDGANIDAANVTHAVVQAVEDAARANDANSVKSEKSAATEKSAKNNLK